MTIQKFISLSFDKIKGTFPQSSILYQFDDDVETHYIKVVPPSVYDDEKFTEMGWELKDLFYEFFPEQDLCFLTDDSLIQISNPQRIYDSNSGKEMFFESGLLVGVVFKPTFEFSLENSDLTIVQKGESTLEPISSFDKFAKAGNYQYAMAA